MSIQISISNAIGSRYRGSVVPPVTPLLLDTYPNAAVAYSLRKLRSAYTGNAIRVRRSSDNTEQDFGFIGNDLDTQTMLDFVGYNLSNYSEDATQTAWTKSRASVSADVEIAPDGTLSGDKVIEDLTLGEHGTSKAIGNNITIPGNTYNCSIYLKPAEITKIRFYSFTGGGATYCDVDLSNGTIVNNTFTNTPVITPEPNGWYRVSIDVVSVTSSSTSFFSIRFFDVTNNISYFGNGTNGMYVWGAQFSAGAGVKTYQKTVATAGGNGFIPTWYDQSTNANDSTQATATNQAQVVLNGNLRLDPNNNKVSTEWTNDSYSLTSSITIAQNFLMFAVINRASVSGALRPLGANTTTPFIFRWLTNGNIDSQITTGTVSHAIADTTIGDYVISALRDNSDVVKAWKNTNALSTGTSTGLAATINRFGLSSTTGSTGWYQELIYWNTDLESSRSAIETAINTYYSVY